MTKPVQISRHTHFQVDPEYDECQFDYDDVGEWVRYSDHVDALLQVREMLEAKAKEWQDAPYAQKAGLDYHNKHPQHAEECDNRAEMIQGMASELLALAATLGNQGK